MVIQRNPFRKPLGEEIGMTLDCVCGGHMEFMEKAIYSLSRSVESHISQSIEAWNKQHKDCKKEK